MNNERLFKEELLRMFKPDWHISIDPKNDDVRASGMNVMFYLVDVATAWVGMGAMKAEHFQEVRKHVVEMGRTIFFNAANSGATEAAAQGATADSEAMRNAMLCAAAYFASTKTCDEVMRLTGSTEGHWVCVVYSLKDGSKLSRPIFNKGNPPGQFLRPDKLNLLASSLIAGDLNSPTGSAGRQIIAAGGTSVHESLLISSGGEPPAPRP